MPDLPAAAANPLPTGAAATLAAIIRGRRTVKAFTGAPVPRDTLRDLCDLATWAPTHRLTQPWRFTVADQPAARRLADWLAGNDALLDAGDAAKATAKRAKLVGQLRTVGALVWVGWMKDADPGVDEEELCAAAAATQNLLLAAHAAGVAAYWSTTLLLGDDRVRRWAGIDPAVEGWVGTVLLGTAAAVPPAPPRVALDQRLRWV